MCTTVDGIRLMRGLVVILSIFITTQAFATSKLWAVNNVYEMAEILHSSRYDYDNGIAITFDEAQKVSLDSMDATSCVRSDQREAFTVIDNAVKNHLYYISQEEFDFDSALNSFDLLLSSYSQIIHCQSLEEYYFFSIQGDFIYSYKKITF